MSRPQPYSTVLTIAGSDSSGGAGIQADLKTIAACGCYGLSVITALTAQNTLGVTDIHQIPTSFITRQFETIVADIHIDAVKIGMLGTSEAAETVLRLIEGLDDVPVVLDTVLCSTSGKSLFPATSMASMKRLFPSVTLITPNIPEAAVLTQKKERPVNREAIEAMALELHQEGAHSVLIKGGHGEGGFCNDCLLHENRFYWFSNPEIVTDNTHGTGCTLASAIASGLARKQLLPEAVARAIDYTRSALKEGVAWTLGHGKGPMQHFPGRFESSPARIKQESPLHRIS
ncbi:MAG: bifunctional hydroxymethylpyrimidine kinase/phosphomethylpyrimidine kinase [Chlorobiaceae bacterium]|nr:bifunctional hydroxymethylpyrimidine kinase/phosphomethylpyrimidine kinase [Chlorobiaceae bacterium]